MIYWHTQCAPSIAVPASSSSITAAPPSVCPTAATARDAQCLLALVYCAQIYNEEVNDLLGGFHNMEVREDPEQGVFVAGLLKVVVSTPAQVLTCCLSTLHLRCHPQPPGPYGVIYLLIPSVDKSGHSLCITMNMSPMSVAEPLRHDAMQLRLAFASCACGETLFIYDL